VVSPLNEVGEAIADLAHSASVAPATFQHGSSFWRDKFRLYARRSMTQTTAKLTRVTAMAILSAMVMQQQKHMFALDR
jgi:hypothetical protein